MSDSFTCPRCGATSHNPNDVEQGYCGRCHWWTGDPVLGPQRPEGHNCRFEYCTAPMGKCEHPE